MVIRGQARSNGRQLGHYLTEQARRENDHVEVLEVRGTTGDDVRSALLEMDLASELTRGRKALYHAQINPAIGEDRTMSPVQWIEAADILEKKLKLTEQARVIVLHEKLGRVHAHVVWQREKDGRLISDSHSFRAHDKARAEMERVFHHHFTYQPDPNKKLSKRLDKEPLLSLREQSQDSQEFFGKLTERGYAINAESRRVQVSDQQGRFASLARLMGMKEADTRKQVERFKAEQDRLAGERKKEMEEALLKAREKWEKRRGLGR